MDTTVLTIILSGIVIVTTRLAKKAKIDQKTSNIVIVGLLSILYYFFKNYLPIEIQENAIMAVSSVVGVAKFLYDSISSFSPKK